MKEINELTREQVINAIANEVAMEWGVIYINLQLKKFEIYTDDESFDDLSEDDKKMACRVLECNKRNIQSALDNISGLYKFVNEMDDDDFRILASKLSNCLNNIAYLLGLNDTYDNINNVVYNNDLFAHCY